MDPKTPSAEDPARRQIERRAVEAVIWGTSAVNTDLMLQKMLTKTTGKVNQTVYWGRPLDGHNQALTPNPDAIYFRAFFNTRDVGPIVIEVPPADDNGSLNGNIVSVWRGRGAAGDRQERGRQIRRPASGLQAAAKPLPSLSRIATGDRSVKYPMPVKLAAVSAVVLALCGCSGMGVMGSSPPNLYNQLGGMDSINKLASGFVSSSKSDPRSRASWAT